MMFVSIIFLDYSCLLHPLLFGVLYLAKHAGQTARCEENKQIAITMWSGNGTSCNALLHQISLSFVSASARISGELLVGVSWWYLRSSVVPERSVGDRFGDRDAIKPCIALARRSSTQCIVLSIHQLQPALGCWWLSSSASQQLFGWLIDCIEPELRWTFILYV